MQIFIFIINIIIIHFQTFFQYEINFDIVNLFIYSRVNYLSENAQKFLYLLTSKHPVTSRDHANFANGQQIWCRDQTKNKQKSFELCPTGELFTAWYHITDLSAEMKPFER